MLYHYSEEPGIQRFEPRHPPPRAPGLPGTLPDVPETAKVVWAIDAWHSPIYYFPRDCPRICFWALPGSSEADRRQWFGESKAAMVACIEREWLDRMQATALYRYYMPEESFRFLDGPNASPGTWVSEQRVVPAVVEPVGELTVALKRAGVELRVMESLLPLRGVWDSSLHASGIRLRNARGWNE
jgi:hypothetical protein